MAFVEEVEAAVVEEVEAAVVAAVVAAVPVEAVEAAVVSERSTLYFLFVQAKSKWFNVVPQH